MSDELTPDEEERVRKSREDIAAGRCKTFTSVDEYIRSLDSE